MHVNDPYKNRSPLPNQAADVTSSEACEVLGLCWELNYPKKFEEKNGPIASLSQCPFYNLIKLKGALK